MFTLLEVSVATGRSETVAKPHKTCADGLIAHRGRGSARTTVQAVSFSDLVNCDRSLTCRRTKFGNDPSHAIERGLSFEAERVVKVVTEMERAKGPADNRHARQGVGRDTTRLRAEGPAHDLHFGPPISHLFTLRMATACIHADFDRPVDSRGFLGCDCHSDNYSRDR